MNASAAVATARQRRSNLPVQSDFFNEDDVMDDAQAASPDDNQSADESDETASDLEPDEVRALYTVEWSHRSIWSKTDKCALFFEGKASHKGTNAMMRVEQCNGHDLIRQ